MTKRNIPKDKIIEMYKSGERDFSDVVCMSVEFDKAVLSGCNFSGSNFSYCSFKEANVSNCNFTKANLEWSSFEKADLRGSNFTKANISWSILSDAKIDKAVFVGTDLSWCLLFNLQFDRVDKRGANFYMSAFHVSEVTEEGRTTVLRELMKKKNLLPFDLRIELEFIIKTGTERLEKIKKVEFHTQYGLTDKSDYQISTEVYGVSDIKIDANKYGVSGTYSVKSKKDKDYELGIY